MYYEAKGQKYTIDVKASGGTYTIWMPKADLELYVDFKGDTYEITAAEVENGTINVAGMGQNGKTITVHAVPAAGALLDESGLTVTRNDGTAVTAKKTGTNTYQFTMPNQAVTVSAVFNKLTYLNDNGSFKPGTYTMTCVFGNYLKLEDMQIKGAMGAEARYSEMTFSVDEDGHMHVDSFDIPVIGTPLGYYGFGGGFAVGTQHPEMKTSGWRIKGSEDYGDNGYIFDDVHYKAIPDENIHSYMTVTNANTGATQEYDGKAYPVQVANLDGSGIMGTIFSKDEIAEQPIATPGWTRLDYQVFPKNISFDIPDTARFKYTDNICDGIIYFGVFPAQMGSWSQMMIKADFYSLKCTSGGGQAENSSREVDVALWNGSGAPGKHVAIPMGQEVLGEKATLTTENGKQSLTIHATECAYGNLYGHLCSFQLYPGATVQQASENCRELQNMSEDKVSYNTWMSGSLKNSEMTAYTGERHQMFTNGQGMYYTTDGVAAKFDGKELCLSHPDHH